MVDYSPEIAERICAEIVEGKSLRSICEQEWAPDKRNVLRWLRKHEEFVTMYNVAVTERSEAYAEEVVEIADNASNDWMEDNDPDNPGWKFNGEHVQRSKLRLEARKWICGKMKPKKYGEKLALGGADDLPPVSVEKIERVLVRANSADRDG